MSPALAHKTVLVDNSPEGRIAERWDGTVLAALPTCRTADDPNLGVPKSWNIGLDAAEGLDVDYLIVLSQSIEFGWPGGCDFLDQLDRRTPEVLCHSQHGWHLLAIARQTWKMVGRFDPIFSPAYFEDTDYLYRMGLAGLPSPRENGDEFDQVVVDCKLAGEAIPLKRGIVKVNLTAQRDAYAAKWGGDQGSELWRHPYGRQDLDWTHIGGKP
jgi:hypothetical protein